MSLSQVETPRPQWRRHVLLLAIWTVLGIGLVYLASLVDWSDVLVRAKAADPVWLGLAVLANLLPALPWAVTWVLLSHLPLRKTPAVLESQLAILATVQSFSLFAGGATAMVLLTRRVGLAYPAALSLLTLDQLVTGFVKVALIGLSVAFAHPPVWMGQVGLTLLAVMCLGVVILLAAHHRERAIMSASESFGPRVRTIMRFLARTAGYLSALKDPLRSGAAFALMLFRRLSEGLAVVCVQKAVGIPVSWELALLVLTAMAIVTVIPQPPGNVGLYEAAVVLVYQSAGYPPGVAIAAALLQHAAFLVMALTPGYLILFLRRPWRQALTQ